MKLHSIVSLVAFASAAAGAHGQIAWSPIAPVNSEAATDERTIFDLHPAFATDHQGTWVAVWESDHIQHEDPSTLILFARSTDNGQTWSPQAPITGSTVRTDAERPEIAFAGGTWLVLWSESNPNKGVPGDDREIYAVRSIDGGETWSIPSPVNTDADSDGLLDLSPHIAGDGDGNWVAAWVRVMPNSDHEPLAARSVDDGLTWSPPIPIAPGTAARPRVASAGGGVWLWVAYTNLLTGPQGQQIVYSRSENNGAAWIPREFLSSENEDVTLFQHTDPDLAIDDDGNVIVAWMVRQTSINGSIPTTDPYYAISNDTGITWTEQTSLLPDPTALQSDSFGPSIATDGQDNWVILWDTSKDLDGPHTSNTDLWFVRSANDGQQWSAPALVNTEWFTNGTVEETHARVHADRRGAWLAGFSASYTNFGNPPNFVDWDIFSTKGTEAGYLTGLVTQAAKGAPIGSAAIRVQNAELGIDRIVVTDRLGAYRADNLPPGTYTLDVFASGIEGEDFALASDTASIVRGFVTKKDFALTPEPLLNGVRGTVFGQVTPGSSVNRVPLVGVRIEAFLPGAKGDDEEEFLGLTFSAADGTYALNALAGAKGEGVQVRVNFDALGFEADDRLPVIPPDANAESNPTLEQKSLNFVATLAGVVSNADAGSPLTGALVELEGPVRVSRTTQPGENGVYVFDAVPPAAYTARVSAPGFATSTARINVPSGDIVPFNPALVPLDLVQDEPRDINGDGEIDAVDVQMVINAALGFGLNGLDADVNRDNNVDAVDVQLVINGALGVK